MFGRYRALLVLTMKAYTCFLVTLLPLFALGQIAAQTPDMPMPIFKVEVVSDQSQPSATATAAAGPKWIFRARRSLPRQKARLM
jgi:hypothetical protein